MNIIEIIKLLNADIIVRGEDKEIQKVFAGDRMSDLIHNADEYTLIITHLNQISLVQLFEIFDVPAICLISDTEPVQELVQSAEGKKTYLFVSPFEMYKTCGIVYKMLEQEQI